MEIKKIVVDGEEVSLFYDPEEEIAVGYDQLPSEKNDLEDTQELDLKGLDLEQTLVIDRNDINE